MTSNDDKLIEEFLGGNSDLNKVYRRTQVEQPSPQLDQAILAQARDSVSSETPAVSTVSDDRGRSFWAAWKTPLALAATVMLGLNLAIGLKDFNSNPEFPSTMGDVLMSEQSRTREANTPNSMEATNEAGGVEDASQSVRQQDEGSYLPEVLPAPSPNKKALREMLAKENAQDQDTATDGAASKRKNEQSDVTALLASKQLSNASEPTITRQSSGASAPPIAKNVSDAPAPTMAPRSGARSTAPVEPIQMAPQSEWASPPPVKQAPDQGSRRNENEVENFAVRDLDAAKLDKKHPQSRPASPSRNDLEQVPSQPSEHESRNFDEQPSTQDKTEADRSLLTNEHQLAVRQVDSYEQKNAEQFAAASKDSTDAGVLIVTGGDSLGNTATLYEVPLVTAQSAVYICDLEAQRISKLKISNATDDALIRFTPPLDADSWLAHIRSLAQVANFDDACTHLAAYLRIYQDNAIATDLPVQMPPAQPPN